MQVIFKSRGRTNVQAVFTSNNFMRRLLCSWYWSSCQPSEKNLTSETDIVI